MPVSNWQLWICGNYLLRLKAEHKVERLWKDSKHIVWRMPFYNETEIKPEFGKKFSILL